jgi:hypothetical protein
MKVPSNSRSVSFATHEETLSVVHEQTKLVQATVELAKTLVSTLAPQQSAAFAAGPMKKSRQNHNRNKKKFHKTQEAKDLDDDNLGDHAHPDATDPPKENYYKPRKDNKITPDDVFDDCGDDTTAIDLPLDDHVDSTNTPNPNKTHYNNTPHPDNEHDEDGEEIVCRERKDVAGPVVDEHQPLLAAK